MSFRTILDKCKNKKAVYIILFIGIILLAVGSIFPTGQKKAEKTTQPEVNYEKDMERRVADILSGIKGAGDVSVMITFENNGTTIPVRDIKTQENQNESKALVINESGGKEQVVVMEQTKPKAKGVVVVAQGGGDIKVQANICKAIEALINVPAHNIAVFEKDSKK